MLKEEYLKLIQDNFPDIQYSCSQLITKWWSNDIIILDENIIFRFPKEEYTRNNFLKEMNLLGILKNEIKNTNIPKYDYICLESSFWWYQLLRWVELESDTINDSNFRNIAIQIWLFLTELHSIDIVKFKDILDLNAMNHYSLSKWYLDYIIKQYQNLEHLFEKDTYKKIINFIENTVRYKIDYSCLTHYDFQWKNIIYLKEQTQINWVIDFSDTAIYDPAIDFLWLLSLPDGFINHVLRNYRIDNWDILTRALFYQKRQLIFTFPDIYNINHEQRTLNQVKQLFS
jgi:aminoglycoside 2''-phosphotransferase